TDTPVIDQAHTILAVQVMRRQGRRRPDRHVQRIDALGANRHECVQENDHIGVALTVVIVHIELLPGQGGAPVYTPESIAAAILAYPSKLQALTGTGGDIMAKGGIGVQRWQMPRQRYDARVHATNLLLRGLEQPGLEISRRMDPAIQPSQGILATLGKHHGMLKRTHLTRPQRTADPITATHTGGFPPPPMPSL